MPKRRGNGEGGLYWVPSRKLYKAVIDVGYDADGRRKQKTVTSRSKKEALQKLADLQRSIKEYGAPIDRRLTVEAWAARWLDEVCRPSMKPTGLAAYESVTRQWIVPAVGKRRIAELKPSDVRQVVRGILDAGRSTATARKTFNVLSGMVEAARKEGLIARNVVKDVKPPNVTETDRGALGDDELRAILTVIRDDPDAVRWFVSLTAGIRQGERLGATRDSVDLNRGTITIQWSLDEIPSMHGCGKAADGWTCGKVRGAACPERRLKVPDGFDYRPLTGRLCLVRPKSGKPRTVPLLPIVVGLLRRHLAETASRPNPYNLIWCHDDGSPYLPAEDQEAWRALLERAGVDAGSRTTHWARHTTATTLLILGVDPKVIGEIVGHQSVAVTRRYQHVPQQLAEDAMARLGERYGLTVPQALPLALAESSPDTKEPPPSRS